jgi:hypothetical protein
MPAIQAVRFAASSGASPRMIRLRYVDLVGSSGVASGLAGGLDVAVADPDPTAETAARTGQEEAPRDDR